MISEVYSAESDWGLNSPLYLIINGKRRLLPHWINASAGDVVRIEIERKVDEDGERCSGEIVHS